MYAGRHARERADHPAFIMAGGGETVTRRVTGTIERFVTCELKELGLVQAVRVKTA
jgi:hypothetical protein